MEKMDEMNRRMADTGEPVFALSAILKRRREEDLARLKQLAGTDDLESWLTDPKNLSMLLMALPSTDFELFCKAAEGPFYKEQQVFLPMHSGVIGFCLLQAYLVQEELYLVVPTEIRNLWRDMKKTGFPERKRLRDTVDAYAQAAVKLYGVLPLKEFDEMLRHRGNCKLDGAGRELLNALADGTYYSLENELLLFPGLSAEEAAPYLEATSGYPRYLPVHEKLLRYGDGDYYDVFHDLELWRLDAEARFREEGDEDPAAKATDFADGLYFILRMELSDEDHTAYFEQFGLEADEERVRSIKQQVRLWILGGNTPAELTEEYKAGRLKPPVNAPCFCGSGKKFKKCHGR